MNIPSLLSIESPKDFKIHAARWNGNNQPLDVFLRDKDEWHDWNKYFGKRHEFNRPYILALADFYPEKNIWLFGGVFQVKNYAEKPHDSLAESHTYDTELTHHGADLIGRLKINASFSRGRTFKLENQIDKLELLEILRAPYTGPSFPGYDTASLIFSDLESIVSNDRQDWKTALRNVKGVYLITLNNGLHYIGSAYGEVGIWSRWENYVQTKDGGNNELHKMNIATNGDYINGARFTLLESWPMRAEDSFIIERENYWKVALSSREFGANSN